MVQYWKYYVWEYLMCIAAASMLLLNAAQGFYIPDALADNVPLAIALCAVLLLLFFLGGYNRTTMVLIPCVTGGLVVAAFLLLRGQGVDIVDQPGSGTAYYIYWFALVVICILVYLGTRFRLGVVLLFLAGCTVQGVLQFLDYLVLSWAGIVFAGSCILLFLLRQYRCQAMNSSTAQPDFFGFFRAGLAMVLAAAVICVGVFFAVIRPLAPPTMELKFLEQYLAFNILEHTGISSSYTIPDMDRTTDQQDDTLSGTEETIEGDTPTDEESDSDAAAGNDFEDLNQPEALTGTTPLSAVSYTVTPVSRIFLLLLAAVLLVVLPPVLRVRLRKRRMRQMETMAPAAQIQALYHFYLKKFQRLGLKKRPGETPFEFAARSSQPLERFLSGSCGLETLTNAYVRSRYGMDTPSDALCAQCREIYDIFLKNCKQQLGFIRYIRKFYVL